VTGEPMQPRPTREETAQREIGHTDIARGTAWSLIVAFLLTLSVPPLAQLVFDLRVPAQPVRELQPEPRLQPEFQVEPQRHPATDHETPSGLQIFATLPTVANAFHATSGGAVIKILAANRQLLRTIDEYERQLEERSLLTRNLLGPTRELLARCGGAGSDLAEIGRDGGLFFRPDIEYLTGPGFLEPAALHRRAGTISHETAAPQPDPRRAILQFHEQLAARGIRLIVMPTPGKPVIYPEQFSARFESKSEALQNSSFEQFKRELKNSGVLVFDPAPVLMRQKQDSAGASLYLRTDTHWTPAAVQLVAEQLREFIERESPLPVKPAAGFRRQPADVTNLGDIAVMLRLPADQKIFPPETVRIQRIDRPDPETRQPESDSVSDSDVLVLGDSFTNIYSLPEMKWGRAAGLSEQLSFALQRPVERLAQNDGGAYRVRQTLFHELFQGRDRLAGKRVVIWQFAARELASGDWKLLPMPAVPQGSEPKITRVPGELVVRGTVRAASGAPRPGTVPYRDAVTGLYLVDVKAQQGTLSGTEIVVYMWGLADNRPTAASHYSPGQEVTLQLVPWDTVRSRYERFNRVELDDPKFELANLPIYWGEALPKSP
jgi:SGNH hydrolase-like domain, acetyltransferase AlgX